MRTHDGNKLQSCASFSDLHQLLQLQFQEADVMLTSWLSVMEYGTFGPQHVDKTGKNPKNPKASDSKSVCHWRKNIVGNFSVVLRVYEVRYFLVHSLTQSLAHKYSYNNVFAVTDLTNPLHIHSYPFRKCVNQHFKTDFIIWKMTTWNIEKL